MFDPDKKMFCQVDQQTRKTLQAFSFSRCRLRIGAAAATVGNRNVATARGPDELDRP